MHDELLKFNVFVCSYVMLYYSIFVRTQLFNNLQFWCNQNYYNNLYIKMRMYI